MHLGHVNHSWRFIPKTISFLSKSSNEELREDETTLSILLLLSTWIESIIYTVLWEEIRYRLILSKRNGGSFESRMLLEVASKLEKATFSDFLELSEIILGKKLSSYAPPEDWRAIRVIFAFRNKVMHGKPMKRTYSSGTITFSGINKEVFDYLVSKHMDTKQLYTRKVGNHFIKIVEDFTLTMMKETESPEESLYDEYLALIESLKEP